MWRHIVSNVLTVLVVVLLGIGAGLGWAKGQFDGRGPLAQAMCFEVTGGTFTSAAERLVSGGAVSHGYIFRAGAQYMGRSGGLKKGSFLIPAGASMREIVTQITTAGASTCGSEVIYRIGVRASDVVLREMDPATQEFVEVAKVRPAEEALPEALVAALGKPDAQMRVNVAEGVTSWQVVQGLAAISVLTGEVAVPAEGSLAPGSYEISKGAARGDLIAQMAQAQAAVLAEAWAGRAADLPYKSMEEALVMASIVEKETGVPQERSQVASVFVNRLKSGMKLQTDPTVIYGVTGGQGVLERGLRVSELKRETPYNTYVINGLPPTPIANPGKAAIEAALNPDSTPYIFFVADGTGGHAFAVTLSEHNANVAKWRALEKAKKTAE